MSSLYREPNKHTCPDIDYIISCIQASISAINSKSGTDTYTWQERCEDVLHHLQDVEQKMEELRSANSTLRDWGNDLVHHAEQLDSEVEDLTNKVEELKERLEELENE